MYSVGAGLSAAGKIPFCSTFSKFITRGYDQIEMAINSGANIKIVGSHSGISLRRRWAKPNVITRCCLV